MPSRKSPRSSNSQVKRHRIDYEEDDDLSHLLSAACRGNKVSPPLETFLRQMIKEFGDLKTELADTKAELDRTKRENQEYREKLDSIVSNSNNNSSIDPHALHETVEMSRAIVIGNVPESPSEHPVARAEHDLHSVKSIVNSLGVEVNPISVYRMGNIGSRPRLLKVILPTRKHQRMLVARAPWLRNSPFRGTWLRQSLPKEERDRRREERWRGRGQQGSATHQTNSINNQNYYGDPQGALTTPSRNPLQGN